MKLDLLKHQDKIRTRNQGGRTEVFDVLRKKWVVLQPEELVRQLLVHCLQTDFNFPIGRMSIERGLNLFGRQRRYDLLCYSKTMTPLLLVECKSPDVDIRQGELDQLALYNLDIKSQYLLLTSGIQHYFLAYQKDSNSYEQIFDIPDLRDY